MSALPTEQQGHGEEPMPPALWGTVFAGWVLLILAVLLLPIAGLLTAVLGASMIANRTKPALAKFFVIAGLVVFVVGIAFRPVIDTQNGIDDPENSIPLEIPDSAE